MALTFVGAINVPTYTALSSDIVLNKIDGASRIGGTVFTTDDFKWYIIDSNLELSDYAFPVQITIDPGTINIGTVDQGAPSVGDPWLVDTELPAASALDGTIGKGLSAPVVGAALLASDGTNLVQIQGTVAGGVEVDVTNGVASGTAGVPASDVITVQGISGGEALPTVLEAGSAIVGKVGIDQTTNGTTNAVSRAATVIAPAATASTNAYVLVPSALLDTLYSLVATFTIRNTGADSINWKVIAGNDSGLAEAIEAQAEATVLSGAYGTFSVNPAIWRYYGVYIKSTVDDTPGEATVVGIVKG